MGRLYRRTRFWRFEVDMAAGMEEFEAVREQRFLHASRTIFGMVRLDGELDPETGEVVLSALGAAVDADVRGGGWDGRTPAQRRADALGEICRQWLDTADRPTVAGERPHVSLSVDVARCPVSGVHRRRSARVSPFRLGWPDASCVTRRSPAW